MRRVRACEASGLADLQVEGMKRVVEDQRGGKSCRTTIADATGAQVKVGEPGSRVTKGEGEGGRTNIANQRVTAEVDTEQAAAAHGGAGSGAPGGAGRRAGRTIGSLHVARQGGKLRVA